MSVDLRDVTEVLSRTPATLRAMLAGLAEPWLDANEGADTFSPRDVVGHLIFGEETDWVPRVRILLEHGPARAFTPFDRFGFRGRYDGRPIAELVDVFERLRRENLRTLQDLALGPADLARPGLHPELGPVTLSQLIATWVVHDLNHLVQIERVMAKRYAVEVGPWTPYLRILQ